MLDFKVRSLNPVQPEWLDALSEITEKHFQSETRVVVRINVLTNLKYIFDKFS